MKIPYRGGPRSLAGSLNEKGGISIKGLFWLLVFASVIYGAYKFFPPFFSYYMLKTEVESEAKVAHMYSDETLARRILTKASNWDAPIERENIVIERGRDVIYISVHYTFTFDFFGKYQKEYVFDINATKPLKESSGVLR